MIHTCNICGKELDFWDVQEDFTIKRRVGYGSVHDGDDIELHICCGCLDRIVAVCKVSPIHYVSEVNKPEVTE